MTEPLDLSLTNHSGHGLLLTSLVIRLKSITLRRDPSPPGRCTRSDFEIVQFRGALPFTVGAHRTVRLSALGIPSGEMPQIGMLNRPYDQDGCEGARLNLSYSETATG